MMLSRFRGQVIGGVAVVCLILPRAFGEVRTWKSASGEHEIEAEFVSSDGTSVKLAKPDGTEMSIPLGKLSAEDRDYVAAQVAPTASSEKQQIKMIAKEFYRAVRDEPEKVRDFLTAKGQDNFDKSAIILRSAHQDQSTIRKSSQSD